MKFTPTIQQANVTSRFVELVCTRTHSSIFLNAVAGSGKTSTVMLLVEKLMELEKKLGRPVQACSVSFNVNIRDASQVKLTEMGSTVQAKTTNQMGRAILVQAARDGLCKMPGKLENDKYRVIVERRLESYKFETRYFPRLREYGKAVTATVKLIDAARSTQVEPTEENLLDIIAHYRLQDEIDVTSNAWDLIWTSVAPAIKQGIKDYEMTGIHDFNDQICLPLSLDVAAPLWDAIFIDESQDLNRARLEMIVRSIKPNGVQFYVGDPFQAIQGFTFADTDSVNTIKRVTNAEEFPLSVCWRCDENIIRLAKVLVPHIEARPNAPEGIIDSIDQSKLMTMLETGYKRGNAAKDSDLVLCRVKADLVKMCLEAIRNGKSAIVRGRDIGKGIITLLDDILPAPFSKLYEAIDEYTAKKVEKLFGKKDAEIKIAELQDRSDTLIALLDGYLASLVSPDYADIDEFKAFINDKFADDETAEQARLDRVKPIVFSTIHKAKGLEYDRVFILSPQLLPHPMAKAGWQTEQEYNILYVAVTRAKHALYFVGGVPASLVTEFQAITHKGEPLVIPAFLHEAMGDLEDDEEQEEVPVSLEAAVNAAIQEEYALDTIMTQFYDSLDAPTMPILDAVTVVEAPSMTEPSHCTPEPSALSQRDTANKGGRPAKGLVGRHVKFTVEQDEYLKAYIHAGNDSSELMRTLLRQYMIEHPIDTPPTANKNEELSLIVR